MIKRELTKTIKQQLNKFPVISITGPRQSGKTTLAKSLAPAYKYYNLEDISTKRLVKEDPVSFINNIKGPVIIDEIQKIPELLSQIQVTVDQSNKLGQFIITGSESLQLSAKISQSLAGRVANNILLPLSYSELKNENLLEKNTNKQMLKGFYPRIYSTKQDWYDFYSEYTVTYVEKDIRQLQNIGDLSLFEKFLQLLAGRVGQLLNITSLSNDVGVSHNTIEKWISLLEASFIAYRLPPFFNNIGKRLIKSPKIYFYDTGLLCYLLGINSIEELNIHYAKGSIFENFIINEIYKYKYNNKLSFKIYFYRDSHRNEVDLIIDTGSKKIGLEIKSAQTFTTEFLTNLKKVTTILENFEGNIIYQGQMTQPIDTFKLINVSSLDKFLTSLKS